MRASRRGCCARCDRHRRGVANARSAGIAVTRASRADRLSWRPSRDRARRSGCAGDATASPRPPASRTGWRCAMPDGCRAGRCGASATRAGVAAMRASRRGCCARCDRHWRGVANGRPAGVAVTRASRAGRLSSRPSRDGARRSGCAGDATASPRPPASRTGRRCAMLDGCRAGRCGASATRAGVAAMRASRRGCDARCDRHWRGVACIGNATALPCRERAGPLPSMGVIDRKVRPTRRDGARCPGAPPRAT